jgi:hypothetical protein
VDAVKEEGIEAFVVEYSSMIVLEKKVGIASLTVAEGGQNL